MFFSIILTFLSLNLFGCTTASGELQAAQELEQQGKLSEAFDAYQQLRIKYAHTHVADLADEKLVAMHFKYAKKVEKDNPKRAIPFYQAIEEKWPGTSEAKLAQKHRLKIEQELGQDLDGANSKSISASVKTVDPEISIDPEEEQMCIDAKAAQSRLIWQQYLQKYPEGRCVAQGQQFLNSTPAREKEIEEARRLGRQCFAKMTEICNEYRLFQTTSNEEACKNPSTALKTEFQRLHKRKESVLAQNDQQYFKNLILPRWNALQSNKDEGCEPIQAFLKDRTQEGIDGIPLQKAIAENCGICFEVFQPLVK